MLTAIILIVVSYFLGRKVGWMKALRWASMKYELAQAREDLSNVEMRKKMERNINQLSDDDLDKFLLPSKGKQ